MALPTLTRTWQFYVNKAQAGNATLLTQSQTMMFDLHRGIRGLGSGWTNSAGGGITPTGGCAVVASSDSVAFGHDAADRWDATTDIVWANAGTAHSWMVYRLAGIGAQFQILIDCVNSGSQNAFIAVSHTGFGAAYGGADGTLTAAPTALNSITLLGTTLWGASGTVSTPSVLHVLLTADGKGARIFICRNNRTCGIWTFDLAGSAEANWTVPYVAGGQGDSTAAPTSDAITAAEAGSDASSLWRGYGTTSFIVALTAEAFSTGAGWTTFTAANSFSSKRPLFPQRVASTTVSHVGSHGVLVDQWYGLSNQPTGAAYPATPSATREFVTFFPFVVPWNGTVPQTA